MPVIISVTGCSTWRRVFISRKKKLRSCAGDELDGAGAVVADGLGEGDGLLAHRLARLLVEEGRRRLLDDLLVAALDRAFALAEVDDVAVLVAEHLDLDVARIDDELLDEDAVVAERRSWPRSAHESKPSATSSRLQAMRMPLPPPPAEALIITG